MKKDLFWKIMAICLLVWLYLWLWSSLIVISSDGLHKTNKLTGKAYWITSEGWTRGK